MLKYMILNMYEICKGLLMPRLAFFPTLYASAAPLLHFFAFKSLTGGTRFCQTQFIQPSQLLQA